MVAYLHISQGRKIFTLCWELRLIDLYVLLHTYPKYLCSLSKLRWNYECFFLSAFLSLCVCLYVSVTLSEGKSWMARHFMLGRVYAWQHTPPLGIWPFQSMLVLFSSTYTQRSFLELPAGSPATPVLRTSPGRPQSRLQLAPCHIWWCSDLCFTPGF